MPTGTTEEVLTYDQAVAKGNEAAGIAEQHHAALTRLGIPQMVDSMSGSGLDSGTLGRLADLNDAHDACVKGAQRLMDSAQALRDGLVRDHGGVNEAHHAAPDGGAEKPFYVPR